MYVSTPNQYSHRQSTIRKQTMDKISVLNGLEKAQSLCLNASETLIKGSGQLSKF